MTRRPDLRGSREQDTAPARLRRAERVLRDRTDEIALLLEHPHDPGNLSATLRTAEALGIQRIHVVREGPWHVRRRVTQRADRWLTVRRWKRLAEALDSLWGDGYRILVAGLGRGALPLEQVNPAPRLAVAFGNESVGATEELLAAADGEFWVPTLGFSGSLNLSVAVAITLWDLRTRQIRDRGFAGDLPDDALRAIREAWYRRLAQGRPGQERAYRAWLGRVDPVERTGPHPDRRTRESEEGA